MTPKTHRRLLKALSESCNITEFIKKVISHLWWYKVPVTWTKKDLTDFYLLNELKGRH